MQHAGHQNKKGQPVGKPGLQTDDVSWIGAVAQVKDARADEDYNDVANIQEDRRGGRCAKPPVDLEDRPEKGCPANQQHIREHDRGQAKREQPIGPHRRIEQHPRKEDRFADDRQREQDHAEQIDARSREIVGTGGAGPVVFNGAPRRISPLARKAE